MLVSVIGLGYIGTPLALLLAKNGVAVIGVDTNQTIIDHLNNGQLHLTSEPDLQQLLTEVKQQHHFVAQPNIVASDIFVIAVPTPLNAKQQPDMAMVNSAVTALCPKLKQGDLIILESTSPVGTIDSLSQLIAQKRPDLQVVDSEGNGDIHLAYCPERVLPGNTIDELVANSRIIGGISGQCCAKSKAMYRTFVKGQMIAVAPRTAEMVKLTENSYRDVSIAFANEISMLCHKLQIDAEQLIALANLHPRVNILQPSTGVGGHCIPIDPWFLIADNKQETTLLQTARQVNQLKPQWVCQQIIDHCQTNNIESILLLGVAFKPNIDDCRESPALQVIDGLTKHINNIQIYDPHVKNIAAYVTEDLIWHPDKPLIKVQLIVVLVAHSRFKGLLKIAPFNQCDILDFSGLTYESPLSKL